MIVMKLGKQLKETKKFLSEGKKRSCPLEDIFNFTSNHLSLPDHWPEYLQQKSIACTILSIPHVQSHPKAVSSSY